MGLFAPLQNIVNKFIFLRTELAFESVFLNGIVLTFPLNRTQRSVNPTASPCTLGFSKTLMSTGPFSLVDRVFALVIAVRTACPRNFTPVLGPAVLMFKISTSSSTVAISTSAGHLQLKQSSASPFGWSREPALFSLLFAAKDMVFSVGEHMVHLHQHVPLHHPLANSLSL